MSSSHIAAIRILMGNWQDGSNETVRLYIDEATRTYHCDIGPPGRCRSLYGDSWPELCEKMVVESERIQKLDSEIP